VNGPVADSARGLATMLRLPLDPVLQLQNLPIEAAAAASSEASIKCEPRDCSMSDRLRESANRNRSPQPKHELPPAPAAGETADRTIILLAYASVEFFIGPEISIGIYVTHSTPIVGEYFAGR
jgi:hypothetical protein